MDVGVTAPAPARYASRTPNDQKTNGASPPSPTSSPGGSSKHSTPNKQVNFTNPSEEKKREKFLTAKYGAHQMALIRKRLRVEMWMYERLQEIYGNEDIEIDIDEVLDMDNELERKQYISNLLESISPVTNTTQSVNAFVGDLLEKVKTL